MQGSFFHPSLITFSFSNATLMRSGHQSAHPSSFKQMKQEQKLQDQKRYSLPSRQIEQDRKRYSPSSRLAFPSSQQRFAVATTAQFWSNLCWVGALLISFFCPF